MAERDTIPSLEVAARAELDTEPRLRLVPPLPRLPDRDVAALEQLRNGIHHAQGEGAVLWLADLQDDTRRRIERAQELLEEAQRVLLGAGS